MMKFVRLSIFLMSVFFVGFAFAVILSSVGGTSFASVNESTDALYNFSSNNTADSEVANITNINVTLPSGFVFVADSNGTDATANFSNTSNTLSWDGDGLVMNGTLQNFWFNATSTATPGDYNFTVIASNFSGVFETQNISVTVNDTVAPGVTVNSPSATNYTVDNVFLNVTSSEAGICVYSLNAGVANVSMDTSDNLTFTKNLTSLSNANYVVNYYCNDSVGNLNSSQNVSFTVAVASSSPSSGGSIAPTYVPTESKLKNGYTISLRRNARVKFQVSGENHYFTLNSISGDKVSVTVSSDSVTFDMNKGEMKKVDVDSDGYYDLNVSFKGVKVGLAEFVLTSINEKVSGQVLTGDEQGNVSDSIDDSISYSPTSTESGSSWIIWVVVVIVLIVVLFLGYLFFLKGKK